MFLGTQSWLPKPVNQTLHLLLPSSFSSCHKISLSLVSDETITESVSVVSGENGFQFKDDGVLGSVSRMKRRLRRRKRRKEKEGCGDGSEDFEKQFSFRKLKSSSRSLSPKEDLEHAMYLKEAARLQAARARAHEMGQSEITLSQWAESVGMTRRSLDWILCKASVAREQINVSYRGFVVHIATPYQGKGLLLEDLIQEGSIGLLRGATKFNPNKGNKLSTYSYFWIKQAIVRAIEKKARLIRLPGNLCRLIPHIEEATKLLDMKLQREPTEDDISDVIDVPASTIKLIRDLTQPPIPLNMSLREDEKLIFQGIIEQFIDERQSVQDITPGPEELEPEVMVIRQQMKKGIHRLVMELSEKEAFVVRLYYGLNGGRPRTCDEIARLLNLSRERIRQIHVISLKKLRNMNNTLNILGVFMCL